jgi:hypothetical protein
MDNDVEQRFATVLNLIQESQGHTAQALEAIKAMLAVVSDMKDSQAELIARIEAVERQLREMAPPTTH